MSHKLAEPYSGRNPVPKITTKLTSLINPEKATEAKAQQVQDRSGQRAEQGPEQTAKRLAKGYAMRATDPTTGEELTIRNAHPNSEADGGENVLAHAFPPPDLDAHQKTVFSSTSSAFLCSSAAYTCALLAALLFGSNRWLWPPLLLLPAFLAYTMHFRVKNTSQNDFQDRIWHSERMRGLRAGDEGGTAADERTKESAEWLNSVLRGVWPIVNPDILYWFSSLVDLIEDIMQSSAPSFVHSVRIADLGLGSNAARITSVRSLPSAGSGEKGGEEISRSLAVDSEDMSPEDKDALDGDHITLELGFAYRAEPSGDSAQSKARNIHLLVEFFVGMRGVFGVKFPVWVEVTGAIGTARARLQLISSPPFVKTTMVTLLGLPHITISVVPLSEHLPNVMNIPFISGFISSAINTAAAEYVAPKSLTLDLQKLISGDDIKKDTEALGVLIVHIHRATGLLKADVNGSSDPYITLTFSRLGTPLYSTRIIKDDLNPVYEETAFVLVDVNIVKLGEKLSFQLWDSDRLSVDDMLGFHKIDVVDLIRQRGKPIRRVSPLDSPDSRHRPGNVEYTVGYYGKLPPNAALSTDGADPGIPDDLRKKPEFREARAVALDDLDAAVLTTPPDQEWVSGILSVQVHDIRDLTVRRDEEGTESKGQDDSGEAREEGEGLPSSYCTISLNDELVYQTRVKPITGSPMFNAGVERFIRDWRKTHVTVTVKDSRMRENDPVLGVVLLKLSELLVNASEVTRVWSIEQGVGHGRIRISVLFRPVEAKLPPNLLGFDIGTLEIGDIAVQSQQKLSDCEVRMKVTTTAAKEKVSRKQSETRDEKVVWTQQDASKLPVRQRYSAALLVSLRDTGGFKTSGRKALGVLWLRDLMDNEDGPVEIALWQAKHGDYSRLMLNYVPPDGDLSCWDSDRDKVERIGSLFLYTCFKPGISPLHYKLLKGGGARKREAWDEYDRQNAGGMRDEVGKMNFGEAAPDAHQSRENHETSQAEGRVAETPEHDKTMSGVQAKAIGGDTSSEGVGEERQLEGTNTVVSADAVESEERERDVERNGEELDGRDDQSPSTADEDGNKGLVSKLKEWRQHQKELHRDHRGIMQAKPARTAQWMKDNVEDGVYAVKERMKMHAREPDVETEV